MGRRGIKVRKSCFGKYLEKNCKDFSHCFPEERGECLRESFREEYLGYKHIGEGTMEGKAPRRVYLLPDGDLSFASYPNFDSFLTLPLERVFEEEDKREAFFKIFVGRGWYAIKKKDGTYDCRFSRE